MVANHFIAARVSSEMKSRLKTLAEQRQLSESALLKRLLELTLDGAAEPQLGNPAGTRRVARAARLYLRLRPDDQLLLAERSAARGMAAATYVSVLVRAHLRHLTPLPKDELVALKRSIAELGAIGQQSQSDRSHGAAGWLRVRSAAGGCGSHAQGLRRAARSLQGDAPGELAELAGRSRLTEWLTSRNWNSFDFGGSEGTVARLDYSPHSLAS